MSRSLTRRPPAASSSPRRSGVAPRARLALPLLAALSLAPSAGCLKVPDDGSHEPEKRDAPATAEEVFARYIAALGGEDQLRALKQRTVEARMIVKPELGCDEDDEQCLREEQVGSFLLQKADGNRLYRSTVLGDQVEERGYDGEVGWQYVAGVLRQDDPQMNEISREDSILHWYFGLAERGIKLTLEPPRDKDFDGQPRVLDGVRWTVMARPEATKTLWFDRDTGLLVEERVEAKADDATTILQRMIYNDYREVDGVQIAHDLRLINSIGERAQEIEFVSTRVHHEPVADEKFEVPDVPPPEPLEDRVLTALESARADAKAAPKDRDAQLRYARAAWAAAHFDEADTAAQATLKLDAKEVEAVWYLARLRILQGRWSEGVKLLKRAAKGGTAGALVAAQEVWVYNHQRDFKNVAAALERASPNNAHLAGRFRSFAGDPLGVSFAKDSAGKGCATTVPLDKQSPLASFEATLGGQKIPVVIDTAATDMIIDDELAKAAGVIVRSSTPIGEGAEMGHGQLKTMTIGDATIENVPVDVLPRATMGQLPGSIPPRAVLGVRLLERFQVTIDMPARAFTLVDASKRCAAELDTRRAGAAVPFWIHETHFIYAHARLNEAEGLYWVNTGMQGVAVAANKRAYAHAGVLPPMSSAEGEVAIVKLNQVAIPGAVSLAKQRGAYGYFNQEQSSDQFRVDGMVGLDLLGAGVAWTLDFDQRKFYFSPSAAGAAKR